MRTDFHKVIFCPECKNAKWILYRDYDEMFQLCTECGLYKKVGE